ncbi:MAG: hypothetical protein Q8N47_16250 [Bryobacterales bacterium]|nr:hypothetical protein [Bryobacterales bacterium]
MDLKAYYEKLRRVEAEMTNRDVVVVSLETPDGGKPGVKIEVPREIAAKLIVESRARLASGKEAAALQAETVETKRQADQAAEASRMKLTVLSDADMKTLKGRQRARKS